MGGQFLLFQFLYIGVSGLEVDHWGTYFLLSFPRGLNDPTNIVVITAREATGVIVTFHGTGRRDEFTLNYGEVKHVEYGIEARASPYVMTPTKQTVSVMASRKVSVYAFSYETRYTDGFLVLPVASLGVDYISVSMNKTGPYFRSQTIIIASEQNTTLQITLNLPLGPAGCWRNKTLVERYHGDIFTFNMNKYDVVNIFCDADTTGSQIYSNKPVAVITGSRRVSIPQNAYWDLAIEMLPPITEYGSEFAVICPHGHSSGRALLRIVALNANTSFNIKGQSYLLGKGEAVAIRDLKESEKLCFTTSEAVIVTLFMTGMLTSEDYDGDAYMSNVPPLNKATNDYMIPRNFLEIYSDEYTGGIDIIARDSLINDISPELSFEYLCNDYMVYSDTSDQRDVTHYTSPSPFVVLVYGIDLREAYGFPAGMKLTDFSGLDECFSSPCQNGGWCLDTSYSFICLCDERYTGSYCEAEVPSTTTRPTTDALTTTTLTTPFLITTTEEVSTPTSTTDSPTTTQPTTESPSTTQPNTESPTATQPSTESSTTTQPTTETPTTTQPTTESPTTTQPAIEIPTIPQPNIPSPLESLTNQISSTTTSHLATALPTTATLKSLNDGVKDLITFKRIYPKRKPCTGALCMCKCPCQRKVSKSDILASARNNQIALKVETKSLSKTRRKKNSSQNLSTSEGDLGLSAVLVVSGLFSVVVLTDISRIFVWLFKKCKNDNIEEDDFTVRNRRNRISFISS